MNLFFPLDEAEPTTNATVFCWKFAKTLAEHLGWKSFTLNVPFAPATAVIVAPDPEAAGAAQTAAGPTWAKTELAANKPKSNTKIFFMINLLDRTVV
jgi:hypothetical protein